MKKKLSKLFISAFAFCSMLSANAQITLHTIGDSTMAVYDPNTSDIHGWGMMFQQFFTSGVVVNDRAKAGASSKSFYLEAPYWTSVKKQIKPGDYVIIQFSHNDEIDNGLDGGLDPANPTNGVVDYKGTAAQTTYKDYLRKYVDETRALGATPILATSMCRKYFSGSTITRAGQHDLGDTYKLPLTDHTYDYASAMRDVAVEKGVQLVDLTALTKTLYESYGLAACTAQLFVSTDSTHPTALGGTLVARLCAQDMFKQNILAPYINTATDLLINPTSCDLGNGYAGQTLIQQLTSSGFDLVPATGAVSFSVSDGFLIAANKTDTYSNSISMSYSNGSLIFSTFYISSTQTNAGVKNGTLTVTNGTITKTIPLTANFIKLTGGTDVDVTWDLSADATYVLTGPAAVVDQSLVGLTLLTYAEPKTGATIWPTGSGFDTTPSTRKVQRNNPDGGTWPVGEIDEIDTRYMQFGVAASPGTELNINNISMYVGGAGGNGMRCRVSYSIDDFVTTFVAGELQSMTSYSMYYISKIPVLKLAVGQTLKVRVYPWYNTSSPATGKSICISKVNIHGVALPTSNLSVDQFSEKKLVWRVEDGFIKISNAPENSEVTVYDLSGRQILKSSITNNILAPKTTGFYIGKVQSSGNTTTTKFFVP